MGAQERQALLTFLLLQVLGGIAFAAEAEDLVTARAGALPILLTAPHGGRETVPGVAPRSRGVTLMDTRTIELADSVAQHLERQLGARPFVVAARFSRTYIDANRAAADAYESPAAKPAYDAYHAEVRRFVTLIRERYAQGGLLVDVHGQSEDPAVVHRGTQNGATVAALLRRHGPDALIGPKSIFGMVQARGYNVFPPNAPLGSPREDRRWNGGYTVQTYGSGTPQGIDAIQVEVGRDLRTDQNFATALGEGIAVFSRTYLQAGAK